MKKMILALVVLTTSLVCLPVFSQSGNEPVAQGLPGDSLNLYAVLDVFQKSPTLKEFERALNEWETNINNLDLNNDNVIDYIEVVGKKNNNSFSVILRVAINSNEYQDVAVIEGHKNYSGKVVVQIIGDEDLYGKYYIVEPSFSETPNPGYVGNQRVIVSQNDVYYVNDWPIIAYLFSPIFSVYISPWHWGFYPTYWHPWTPVFFHVYWDFNRRYYVNNFYRRSGYLRYPVSHSYYINRRQSSPVVRQYRREGRYDRVYDGRTYKRPIAPERRVIAPSTRQGRPSTTRPATRKVQPSTTHPPMRQEQPSTRQVQPSTTRPATIQVQPSTTRPPIRQEQSAGARPSANPSSEKSNKPGNRR
jgi:hypothetical protein